MEEWLREFWQPGGGDAFLFYAVFGHLPTEFEIDGGKYRTRGLPEAIDLRHFSRSTKAEYIDGFLGGQAWLMLQSESPELTRAIEAAPDCLVVAGTVADPQSLAYLQDAVGVVTWLLDRAGVAVLDLQTLSWYEPGRWHEEIFGLREFDSSRHVVILVSPQPHTEQFWFHTRGMRKFGRPDISIHDVRPAAQEAVGQVINRLIDHQARGGIVAEGQTVRVIEPPWLGTAHHAGDLEDLDFNNVHIELLPAESNRVGS